MDKITISRFSGASGSRGVAVMVESENHVLYRGYMTIENFGHLVSGMGYVSIERDSECLIGSMAKETDNG